MWLSRTTPIAPRAWTLGRTTLHGLAFVLATLVLAACGGPSEAGDPGSTMAGPSPVAMESPMALETPRDGGSVEGSPGPSIGPSVELCGRIVEVETRLVVLNALELRPTARVTLDIELSRLQVAFSEMRQAAIDARGLDLDETLRQLGYRLDDLSLAVEDFRTTSRPREAADHVAEEAVVVGDALAGFRLLVGC